MKICLSNFQDLKIHSKWITFVFQSFKCTNIFVHTRTKYFVFVFSHFLDLSSESFLCSKLSNIQCNKLFPTKSLLNVVVEVEVIRLTMQKGGDID